MRIVAPVIRFITANAARIIATGTIKIKYAWAGNPCPLVGQEEERAECRKNTCGQRHGDERGDLSVQANRKS
jgi:hypothetical protein